MCSEAEAREREACRELSALEQRAANDEGMTGAEGGVQAEQSEDLALAVKRYQRPAAGAPAPPAAELRPLPVLHRTVAHLLGLWHGRQDVPPLQRCFFISDRLRAVHQDMTVSS